MHCAWWKLLALRLIIFHSFLQKKRLFISKKLSPTRQSWWLGFLIGVKATDREHRLKGGFYTSGGFFHTGFIQSKNRCLNWPNLRSRKREHAFTTSFIVLKVFIDQKARRKGCTKRLNPIFRCATPSTGQIWEEKLSLVHYTSFSSWCVRGHISLWCECWLSTSVKCQCCVSVKLSWYGVIGLAQAFFLNHTTHILPFFSLPLSQIPTPPNLSRLPDFTPTLYTSHFILHTSHQHLTHSFSNHSIPGQFHTDTCTALTFHWSTQSAFTPQTYMTTHTPGREASIVYQRQRLLISALLMV